MARLATAWCIKNPNVSTVILGASKKGHLEETLKSHDDVTLITDDINEKIEEILENKPLMPQW